MSRTPVASPFGPLSNALLVFRVSGLVTTDDPVTGNPVPLAEELRYEAALTLSQPRGESQPGVDLATYQCKGRLLNPVVLDPRVTNGSHAEATINGARGRFELALDLSVDRAAAPFIREAIQGTFRVVGGVP